MSRTALPAYVSALALGGVLWALAAIATGRVEPWDSRLYWQAAYPAAVVLSAGLGFAFPHRSWRWAFAVMAAQAVVMALAGAGAGLLPLGLVLLAVLAVPGAALAIVAGAIRRGAAS